MIHLEVVGLPAPQGSKTRMPNGAMLDGKSAVARAKLSDWRTTVAAYAREAAAAHGTLDGPLSIAVNFRMPMPVSRPKALRVRGWAWKTTKPDGDKLLRATLDALVHGGLIRDDALVACCWWAKVETTGWTGAAISVSTLGEGPQTMEIIGYPVLDPTQIVDAIKARYSGTDVA